MRVLPSLTILALMLAGLLLPAPPLLAAEFTSDHPPVLPPTRTGYYTSGANVNVVAEAITVAELPEQLAAYARKRLTACDALAQEGSVGVTRWVSEHTRQKNLAPDYLIDFTAVKLPNPLPPACAHDSLCSREGCEVHGFVAQEDGRWIQMFFLSALSFGLAQEPLEDGRTATLLETVAVNESCLHGVTIETGCLRRYAWGVNGLEPVAVPK